MQNQKLIAILSLGGGLTISIVSLFYSVTGLMAIFSAAAIPVMIMGIVLEVNKLIATVWLKQNWNRAPALVKTYLLLAVLVLMVITSMGTYGFLAKSHADQALPSGDIIDKLAILDDKIKVQKEIIESARKSLSQMDMAVDETMGRSTSENGADRAYRIRKSQTKERAALQANIDGSQHIISDLNAERAPIARQMREVTAETGPLRYLAGLIYGDNVDANVLERAVRWMIVMLVFVFDPLAVILILASQYSFKWAQEEPEEAIEEAIEDEYFEEDDSEKEHCPKCDTVLVNAPGIGMYCPNLDCEVIDNINNPDEKFTFTFQETKSPEIEEIIEEESEEESEEERIVNAEKEAKRKFKEENPGATLHEYELKKELGLIDKLPWEDND